MHRLNKRHIIKGGFSLLEMIIVIAIIVILAGVVGVGVAGMIRTAKNADSAVKDSSLSLNASINSGESSLSKYGFSVG
ncbi:prepilin-type N-terminal cleavage/methylation domain-containing protein [Ruminococcaceae bacterium R-25]|nr:prepilin-type N-terminal cleavage/methylation domain-containing protein [Ruminococcaceae bacterium R-25]SUQ21939.1 prepilin-type N-terminal cleavage/methylation domain-containing protein [Oscillospiraceae bacterium]